MMTNKTTNCCYCSYVTVKPQWLRWLIITFNNWWERRAKLDAVDPVLLDWQGWKWWQSLESPVGLMGKKLFFLVRLFKWHGLTGVHSSPVLGFSVKLCKYQGLVNLDSSRPPPSPGFQLFTLLFMSPSLSTWPLKPGKFGPTITISASAKLGFLHGVLAISPRLGQSDKKRCRGKRRIYLSPSVKSSLIIVARVRQEHSVAGLMDSGVRKQRERNLVLNLILFLIQSETPAQVILPLFRVGLLKSFKSLWSHHNTPRGLWRSWLQIPVMITHCPWDFVYTSLNVLKVHSKTCMASSNPSSEITYAAWPFCHSCSARVARQKSACTACTACTVAHWDT